MKLSLTGTTDIFENNLIEIVFLNEKYILSKEFFSIETPQKIDYLKICITKKDKKEIYNTQKESNIFLKIIGAIILFVAYMLFFPFSSLYFAYSETPFSEMDFYQYNYFYKNLNDSDHITLKIDKRVEDFVVEWRLTTENQDCLSCEKTFGLQYLKKQINKFLRKTLIFVLPYIIISTVCILIGVIKNLNGLWAVGVAYLSIVFLGMIIVVFKLKSVKKLLKRNNL